MRKTVGLIALAILPFSLNGMADPPKLTPLMKKKLNASKQLLKGLAKRDFPTIQKAAQALHSISTSEEWKVFKDPKYRLYSSEFGRLSERIMHSAKEKNLDEATLHYLGVTMTCVNCHKHVRDVQEN